MLKRKIPNDAAVVLKNNTLNLPIYYTMFL